MNTPLLPPRARPVLAIAAALFVVQMVYAARYGVFRDELYYVACGNHVAFGYVDHPPLVALLARAEVLLIGDSPRALRFLPAVLAATNVVLAGALARLLRGGAFAQVLAAACVALAPEFLGTFHILSMNALLPPAWTACAIFAVRALVCRDARAWVWFGLVAGLGLEAKHSTLFYGAGLVAGLLATPHRRALATRGPWLAFGLAALLLAPNVAWEQIHGWPTLEFMENAKAHKMVAMTPLAFASTLPCSEMLPADAPGLGRRSRVALHRRARATVSLPRRRVRRHSRDRRGRQRKAVLPRARVPRPLRRRGRRDRVLAREPRRPRGAPRRDRRGGRRDRSARVADSRPTRVHRLQRGAQDPPRRRRKAYDGPPAPIPGRPVRAGEAMAERVATAYQGLPAANEQRVAAFYTTNYGEAGALDLFGPRFGLPRAVACGHNSYFLWGPPPDGRGAVLITVGVDREDLLETYEVVDQLGETSEPYAMPYENHLPIFVARKPRRTVAEAWPSTKHFI